MVSPPLVTSVRPSGSVAPITPDRGFRLQTQSCHFVSTSEGHLEHALQGTGMGIGAHLVAVEPAGCRAARVGAQPLEALVSDQMRPEPLGQFGHAGVVRCSDAEGVVATANAALTLLMHQ